MHGELKKQYMNEAHEKAMTAPIDNKQTEYDPELIDRVRRHM